MKTKNGIIGMVVLAGFVTVVAGAEPGPKVSSGSLHVPPGVKVTLIDSQRRDIEIMGAHEPVQLQADAYRILHWTVERRDDQGELWRLRAKQFTQDDVVQIDEGQEAVLGVGEPVPLFLYKRQEGRGYRFTCDLKGQMGEPVEVSNRRGHAIPPQLLIANVDSSYQQTIDFHFG
jgi:hypothetical protein